MSSIFHEVLYRPLFNLLIGIYNVIPGHDLAIAIVLLTLVIKIILSPLSVKMFKSQKDMAVIQPKIKALQEKHKGDKQAFAQAQVGLFKEHNVNPLSGCLPLLIQLPVIFVLYRVFINGLKSGSLEALYAFVHNPGVINTVGFGFLNLTSPNHILAIMAGIAQGLQAWLMARLTKQSGGVDADNPAAKMSQQMMYIFPVMIVFITWKLPAGLALYFVTTTVWSVFEQLYIKRRFVK